MTRLLASEASPGHDKSVPNETLALRRAEIADRCRRRECREAERRIAPIPSIERRLPAAEGRWTRFSPTFAARGKEGLPLSLIPALIVAVAVAGTVCGCSSPGGQVTRFQARPAPPTVRVEPGEHPLGLDRRRDGLLYVPKAVAAGTPLPLFVMLHGGGDRAADMRYMFPIAEDLGVAVVAPDARDNTWDGIDSRIGPDVEFIDAALRHAFQRLPVDPTRLAIGGASDGASYALSLGLANGDLFTHLIAFAPGSIFTPGPPAGRPRIFIAHGTRDRVLPIDFTSRRMVPRLRDAGYDVTYREFDAAHTVTNNIAREALEYLTQIQR